MKWFLHVVYVVTCEGKKMFWKLDNFLKKDKCEEEIDTRLDDCNRWLEISKDHRELGRSRPPDRKESVPFGWQPRHNEKECCQNRLQWDVRHQVQGVGEQLGDCEMKGQCVKQYYLEGS